MSLSYARGANQRGTTVKILAGQYLGFGGILLVALLVALGARSFLPEAALPYFGLIPLVLGRYAGWRVWRNDDDDDDDGKVAGNKSARSPSPQLLSPTVETTSASMSRYSPRGTPRPSLPTAGEDRSVAAEAEHGQGDQGVG